MDAAERDLVYRAVLSSVTGDCEWEERAARRVRRDAQMKGFTPEAIQEMLRAHVVAQGIRAIEQRPETRQEYSDRRFYYRVVVPAQEFRHGLFVELVLVDEDPEAPAVRIVNAHEQKR